MKELKPQTCYVPVDVIQVTHWLQKQENVYLLTKEELEQIINDAINAGHTFEYDSNYGTYKGFKETYIDNLFKIK